MTRDENYIKDVLQAFHLGFDDLEWPWNARREVERPTLAR